MEKSRCFAFGQIICCLILFGTIASCSEDIKILMDCQNHSNSYLERKTCLEDARLLIETKQMVQRFTLEQKREEHEQKREEREQKREEREQKRFQREQKREERDERSLNFCLFILDPNDIKSTCVAAVLFAGAFGTTLLNCCHRDTPKPMLLIFLYFAVIQTLGVFLVLIDPKWFPAFVTECIVGALFFFGLPLHFRNDQRPVYSVVFYDVDTFFGFTQFGILVVVEFIFVAFRMFIYWKLEALLVLGGAWAGIFFLSRTTGFSLHTKEFV